MSEWSSTLIAAYRVALHCERTVSRVALETFMALFWILSAAVHWFFVWALVVQVTSPNPSQRSAESANFIVDSEPIMLSTYMPITPLSSRPPSYVRQCVPVPEMESAFRVIEELVEPSAGYLLLIFLTLCSTLVVFLWPEIKSFCRRQPPQRNLVINVNVVDIERGVNESTAMWICECIRRDSLILLWSLLSISLLLKSPFFIYRFYCQRVPK